jgi:multiple sugar transport system permease protein
MLDSLKDTGAVTLLFVPIGIGVQIVLAVLLNSRTRFRGLLRVVFYLPVVIPVVVSVLIIWKGAVVNQNGLLDAAVHLVNADASIFWLESHARAVLVAFMVWSTAGVGMMIFLAALQNIPRELRESASIDGATQFQALRTITLPLLTPVIFLQIILGFVGAAQILLQPILFGDHGATPFFNTPPAHADVVPSLVWRMTFSYIDYSRGAAMSWLLFMIVLLGTLTLFGTSRFWVFYGED